MSRRARLAAAAVATLIGLGFAGCDALPGRPNMAKREVVPSQVTSFTVLYGRHCAGCHGADGRLGAARPLNDPLYLALIPTDLLRTIIAQGVPGGMAHAFAASAGGPLTDAQLGGMVRDMVARWGRPDMGKDLPLPPYSAADAVRSGSGPGNPQRGMAVYLAACAGCHGPEGQGGPKGGSVVDTAFLALVSDQGLRTAVIAGRPDLGMPDWRGLIPGKSLTPEQISDVVAWLVARRLPPVVRPGAGAEAGGKPS
jgi:mono/diheme cytochrome c family protein